MSDVDTWPPVFRIGASIWGDSDISLKNHLSFLKVFFQEDLESDKHKQEMIEQKK